MIHDCEDPYPYAYGALAKAVELFLNGLINEESLRETYERVEARLQTNSARKVDQ